MFTGFLEGWISKLALNPKTIAIMVQTTFGLSLAILVGQLFAFQKYIKLNEPVYQIFSFTLSKSYDFVMNTLKNFGIIVLAYLLLLVAGFFMKEDFIGNYQTYLMVGYCLFLLFSFGFGFSKERTRSLSENMITKS